jgi:hypothetical protein
VDSRYPHIIGVDYCAAHLLGKNPGFFGYRKVSGAGGNEPDFATFFYPIPFPF